MAQPFLSEIRIFSFNYPPKGWALCNGQTMAINQNQAVFALLGTTYGGDGRTTFQLPNFQGRVGIHQGTGSGGSYVMGQVGGEAAHTVTVAEMPTHTHSFAVATSGILTSPKGNTFCTPLSATPLNMYSPTDGSAANAAMIGTTGGSQPHGNMQPFLALSFCIALTGIFPSRN